MTDKAAAVLRTCLVCRKALIQKPEEYNARFAKRETCGVHCGGRLAWRRRRNLSVRAALALVLEWFDALPRRVQLDLFPGNLRDEAVFRLALERLRVHHDVLVRRSGRRNKKKPVVISGPCPVRSMAAEPTGGQFDEIDRAVARTAVPEN